MRICIVSEYFYPDSTGGTGTVLSKLVRQLKDAHPDLHVDVIASHNPFRGEAGSLPRRENWDGISIYRLPTPQPRKNSMKRRLLANLAFTFACFARLITRPRRYDAVLFVTAPPTLPLAGKLFSQMTGTPFVYLVYDLYLDLAVAMDMVKENSRTTRAFRHVQKNWFARAAKIIVLGRCMRDHLARQYQVPLHKMEVAPIPSDLQAIVPLPSSTRFRQQNDLDGFVVMYAGNFAKYQDFETLLDAARMLLSQAHITLVFVGGGAKKEYIENRVRDEKLTNVRLLPFVPESELCDMLASADVSLVTLEKGTQGLAVPSKFYNIMASGRPTIAVVDPTCEVARVIEEAQVGMQVSPEDAELLAQSIAYLAHYPEEAIRMGENARRVCEEKYSMAHIAQQFYKVFCEVADARVQRKTTKAESKMARRDQAKDDKTVECCESAS